MGSETRTNLGLMTIAEPAYASPLRSEDEDVGHRRHRRARLRHILANGLHQVAAMSLIEERDRQTKKVRDQRLHQFEFEAPDQPLLRDLAGVGAQRARDEHREQE